ncbi:mitochondrial ATP synthase g subunit-domain-containing protein [Mycena rosella]|uniref:Mitochondrial ATP synthase g subunit-domain-containing protein n=1 Tax=Mycena rosella TaxID=1033263 RepID=A0AAD7GXN4_MYCRO|nr:mitochondrial ATP synthase g subunit-domain-containing protein [Mycena rosella]
MSPLLSSSLRQAVRPALRQRVRFNSSKPPPSPEKKAQEVIANAQKGAGQLWESATKKAEEVVGSSETITKNAEKLGKNAGQLWASTKTTLGPAAEKAEALLGSTLNRLGPTGKKAAGLIGPARNSFLYNFAVFREIVKQVYRAELQPPKDLATIRTAYETLYQRATDASYWRGIMQSGEIARVGIYAVEAYGIFKIGEIIGRRQIVGYPLH